MLASTIGKSLEDKGYSKASGNVKVADFFIKVNENKEMTICSIIKNYGQVTVTSKQIVATAKQLERKFLIEGYKDVSIMHMIITDHDMSVDDMESENINFWVVDLNTPRLVIYENQPMEFEDLHGVIEENLYSSEYSIDSATSENINDRVREKFPLITAIIIAINVVMFIICEFIGGSENVSIMLDIGADNYIYTVEKGQYYRLITSMFLHFGIDHIVNNMLSLALIGGQIEKVLGKLNFSLIYLASGLGGSVASTIYHMSCADNAVSAGASGAIFGLLGAVIACVMKDKSVSLNRIIMCVIIIVLTGTGVNVDVAAHMGGLIIGFITTLALHDGVRGKFKVE